MTIMSSPATDKPFSASEPVSAQAAAAAASPAPQRPLTLTPDSAVQFVDAFVTAETAAGVLKRYFEDDAVIGAQESGALFVVALEDGVFLHPVSREVADISQTYTVDGEAALQAFANAWLPVPLLRVLAPDTGDGRVLDEGPTNWARIYLARGDEPGNDGGWHAVLALDSSILRTDPPRDRATPSPTAADVRDGVTFVMSADEGDVGAFVTEAWVDDWLREVDEEHARRRYGHGDDEWQPSRPLEHIAHYLTLLSVLSASGAVPDVRFVDRGDNAETAARAVDLVIDFGAARTSALLREASPDADPARPPIEQLEMRDLSRPWIVYRGILPSRCTFARTQLGKEALSRWSGRANAFYWPSLARIGQEAERLAAAHPSGDESIGISSPIRYLWDERRSEDVWRFARTDGGAGPRGSIVSGPQLAGIGETGEVLTGDLRGPGTTKPRFARSSLITFFAAELVMHALSRLNASAAPGAKGRQAHRQLGRILLTLPGNMHGDLQRLLKRRVEDAVELVWQGLGWDKSPIRRRRPEVAFTSDNATNAATVYLYNEIVHKFRGQAREYFELMGKARPGQRAGRSLRIASFDIGAGTTAISVATYELGQEGQIARVAELIDGLPAGGDDALKAVIERHILPALRERLVEAGLPRPDRFLERVVMPQGGRNPDPRLEGLASRLASHLLRPAAIALLREHAASPSLPDHVPVMRTLGFLLAQTGADARSVADVLDELAAEEGASSFSPLQTPVTFQHRDLAETIGRVLSPVLESAIKLVQALDCDIVLLSGWPARLPVVLDTLVQGLPTRPSRIVAMHDYRVADWYPGRLESERIAQPKTIAAVGGLIEAIGSLKVANRGTAAEAQKLVLGRLAANGTIAADDVLFTLSEPGSRDAGPAAERSATVTSELPLVIGMRRLALESWPATPLYQIDFTDGGAKERTSRREGKGPFKITFERAANPAGGYDIVSVTKACNADGSTILPSEIDVRGQTLKSPEGHWLDTGALSLEPDGDKP
jgi:hypothetical protein